MPVHGRINLFSFRTESMYLRGVHIIRHDVACRLGYILSSNLLGKGQWLFSPPRLHFGFMNLFHFLSLAFFFSFVLFLSHPSCLFPLFLCLDCAVVLWMAYGTELVYFASYLLFFNSCSIHIFLVCTVVYLPLYIVYILTFAIKLAMQVYPSNLELPLIL